MDQRTGKIYILGDDGAPIQQINEALDTLVEQGKPKGDSIQNLAEQVLTDAQKTDIKPHLVPVKRDLTKIEKAAGQIKLYSPCACGSGKKFKFCCKK